jgi:Zn-finger nucleic acid-binding protein
MNLRNLLSTKKDVFLTILKFSAIGLTAFSPLLISSNAYAGNCSSSSCNGADPSTMQCTKDSYTATQTVKSYWDWATRREVKIELRYSPSCRAVWNRSGEVISGSRLWLEKEGSPQSYNLFTTQSRGTYYTNMLEANTRIKACVEIPNKLRECGAFWKP